MTDEQPDLWGRTDDAIDRADRHADDEWKEIALATVFDLARRLNRFTAEDVTFRMADTHPDVTTHEPRALGAVMRRAASKRWIIATQDYTMTRRDTRNAAPVRVWASLIR